GSLRSVRASTNTDAAPSTSDNPVEAAIISQWKELLSVNNVTSTICFKELGADSLTSIDATMRLEKLLGQLPERWETLTVGQLARSKRDTKTWFTRVDSTVLLRALSITTIVAAHLGLPEIAGSVRTLFVVSGMSFGKYL